MSKCQVQVVSPERIQEIVSSYDSFTNRWQFGRGGMYMAKECGVWVGCDNRDGFAWTQEFQTMCDCLNWLYDRIDSEGNMYGMGMEECITFISEMMSVLA